MERHVARLRSRVEERVWSMLAAVASPETRSKLETLLRSDGGHQSLLDRLRKGPTVGVLLSLSGRWTAWRKFAGLKLPVVAHRIPTGRLHALARFANAAKSA